MGAVAPGDGNSLPSAPLNLVADPGNGLVWLYWDHPSSQGSELIKFYSIYRDSGSGPVLVGNVSVGETSYLDDSLTNGVNYSYNMRAWSDVGAGEISSTITVTPMLTGPRPTQPSEFHGQNGIYWVDLNWLEPSEMVPRPYYYSIYRGIYPDIDFSAPIVTLAHPYSNYVDYDVIPGVHYAYGIRSGNAFGVSQAFLAVEMEVGGTGEVPSEPLGLQVVPGDDEALLTWWNPENPSSNGISRYEIFRSSSPGDQGALNIGNISFGVGNTFIDAAATNEITWYYRVRAVGSVAGPSSYEDWATPSSTGPEPRAPNNLMAKRGPGSVALLWEPPKQYFDQVSTLLYYDIYRSTSSGGQGTTVATIDANGFFTGKVLWIDSNGTMDGTTYYFVVKARNAAGSSEASNEASATPSSSGDAGFGRMGIFATPFPDSVAVVITDPLPLPDFNVLGYKVYRAANADMTSALLLGTIGYENLDVDGTITFIDATIDAGDFATYYYAITPFNLYGEGDLGYPAKAFAPPNGDPPEQTSAWGTIGEDFVNIVYVSNYSGTSTFVAYFVMRWSESSPVTLIKYQYALAGEPTGFQDTGLRPGTTYYYIVQSVSIWGSSNSYVVEARLPSPPGPPNAPQNLTAMDQNDQILLTWEPPTNAQDVGVTGYLIYRSTTTAEAGELIADLTGSTTSFTDSNVLAGVQYYYRMKARNNLGQSGFSQWVGHMLISTPSEPLQVGASSSSAGITVSWQPPSSDGGSSIVGYYVYRRSPDATGYEIVGTNNYSTTSYLDEDLLAGESYSYFVVAFNEIGWGEASSFVDAKASENSEGFEASALILVALIALIGIVAVIVILMKRRR